MKIGQSIIRNKHIKINTNTNFEAYYKKHFIIVSSDHKLGKPIYDNLTRFSIIVLYEDGGYIVDTYEDLQSRYDAINYAIENINYKRI